MEGRGEKGKEEGTETEEKRKEEGKGQGRPPKLKLAPQNYFSGAGAGCIAHSDVLNFKRPILQRVRIARKSRCRPL